MKLRDDLRGYLTTEQVNKCWRCGKELTMENYTGTSGMPEIECPICGFIVEVYSRRNKTVEWAFISTIVAFAFGVLLATLL